MPELTDASRRPTPGAGTAAGRSVRTGAARDLATPRRVAGLLLLVALGVLGMHGLGWHGLGWHGAGIAAGHAAGEAAGGAQPEPADPGGPMAGSAALMPAGTEAGWGARLTPARTGSVPAGVLDACVAVLLGAGTLAAVVSAARRRGARQPAGAPGVRLTSSRIRSPDPPPPARLVVLRC